MNPYRGGPFQQALSGVTNLNNSWYDGKEFQVYGLEYASSPLDYPEKGYVSWFVGRNHRTWHIDARALRPNGNIGSRVIPREPMAIVMNLGMSPTFAKINWTGIAQRLPAMMRVDYIRIYQNSTNTSDDRNDQWLTCDPPGYETTDYISQHPRAYEGRNLTLWSETGYAWPRNSFVDGPCEV